MSIYSSTSPDNDESQAPRRPRAPALFGNSARTAILLLVAVLEETYPAQLARLMGTTVPSIQKTLDRLEREGLIASRAVVVRHVTLNPLYPAAHELRALLLRIAE